MSKIFNIATESKIVALSGSKSLFKKQLIRFGEWIDPIWPDEVMRIDRVFLEQILKNYKAGIPGRIPVPLTHTDNPEKNSGEIVDLMIEGDGTSIEDGLYGIMEIRREETADDIRNELIFDVSISFSNNYVDTENGAQYGPTLLHVALVNNPYIKKMGGFTSLSEELEKFFGKGVEVRSLSETATSKEIKMAKVTNDREFAVKVRHIVDGKEQETELAPGAELELSEEQVEAVTKQLSEAEAPKAEGGEGDAGEGAGDGGDKNLSETERQLRDANRELSEMRAQKRADTIDKLYGDALNAGKIVPAQEESFRALCDELVDQTRNLSDGTQKNLSEVLTAFVDLMPRVIALNEEKGANGKDDSPASKLSEETKQVLQKQGVAPEKAAELGMRESISINELAKKEN